MGKIKVALIDDESQGAEHQACYKIEPEELRQLFKIADRITDKDLEKISRMVKAKVRGKKSE